MTSCFLLEPTDRARLGLRRYSPSKTTACPLMPGEFSYHQALVLTGEAEQQFNPEGYAVASKVTTPHDDPRWPTQCACGYVFADNDNWQDWSHLLWRRPETGEEMSLRDAPPGAMWDAWWLPWKGPDGKSLTVKCPDRHEWTIDGVASNCTIHTGKSRQILPYDPDPTSAPEAHRCWIRHGEPPNITVDKSGHTCNAGAGSIATPGYHGFLRDGVFT